MKKLMFAATAMLCGAVMAADITSANVVGYQQQSLDANYNIVCVNFQKISGTPKLSDFTVNENFLMSPLDILSSSLALETITLPEVAGIETETIEAAFEYYDAEWFTEDDDVVYGEKTTGWYLRNSNGQLYNMNDYEVPFGKSVCVDCSDEDAAIQLSGQVSRESLPVDLVANFNVTGNCTPRDITLGEVTVNENFLMSPLDILSSSLALETITLPEVAGIETETIEAAFEYYDAEWFTEDDDVVYGEKTTGWYLRNSNGQLYNMNAYVVPAGKGLVVDCSDENAQIILPEAL